MACLKAFYSQVLTPWGSVTPPVTSPMKHTFVQSPSHNSALGPVDCGRSDAGLIDFTSSSFGTLALGYSFLLIPYSIYATLTIIMFVCNITDKHFQNPFEPNIISPLSPKAFLYLKQIFCLIVYFIHPLNV